LKSSGAFADEVSFDNLVKSIEQETGLCFPEVHHDTILKAARKHCAALGLAPEDYSNILQNDSEEKSRFLDDIMIGETYFFRDEKHFAALADWVLPQLFAAQSHLNIWSATCASGEEAISLIAVLDEVKARLACKCEYNIMATDINRSALKVLHEGIYTLGSFRTDGKRWHGLLDGCGFFRADSWVCKPEILERIQVRHLNLLTGNLPKGPMDLIFFRNTLVYMKQEQKELIIKRIVELLRPGGFLFLASPEVPSIRHAKLKVLEREGTFFFQRIVGGEVAGGSKPADMRPVVTTAVSFSGQCSAAERSPETATLEPRLRKQRMPTGKKANVRDLRLALTHLSGEGSAAHTGFVGELAHIISSISMMINQNRFSYADSKLDEFECIAGENFLSLYLRGLLRKHQGNLLEAIDLWERSRLYEAVFWPASFNIAVSSLEKNPERSKELLQECLKAMAADGAPNQYVVLLDGFDTAYYRHMAQKLLAKIES